MGRKRKKRRQAHGSAWYWKQTGCWYYTMPGTRKRSPLFGEDGKRIRGKENCQAADLALARVKVAGQWRPSPEPATEDEWLVARVCSEYVQNCEHAAANGTIGAGYRDEVVRYLNQLCDYCGSLPVSQLAKGHVQHWVESHPTWRSPVARHSISVATTGPSSSPNQSVAGWNERM